MISQIDRVWKFRGFILGSIKRDFESRYKHSLLGAAWTVLVPLTTILIYIVIFSKLMNTRLPNAVNEFSYSIYLCTGMITWSFFAEILSRCNNIFLENGNLIKKLNFPRICLPLAALGGASINFVISLILFFAVMLLIGHHPQTLWLLAIPIMLVQTIFALGLGVIFGIINVFFRDMGQLFGIIMSLWFWTTPIVYPMSILPGWVAKFVSLNPMAVVICSLQEIIVSGTKPSLFPITILFLFSLAVCVVAMLMYRGRIDEMVDEL